MNALDKVQLKGIAASPGVATGIVKVVHGAQDSAKFNEGDILVAEVTEPTTVMMMNKAAAIVTDRGGITSHAAVISRELGVPCVTATKTATTELKDGLTVRVDGTSGEVHQV